LEIDLLQVILGKCFFGPSKMNDMLAVHHKTPAPVPAENPIPPQHPNPDETPVPDHNPTDFIICNFREHYRRCSW
jgi:hypothetical protein